MSKFMFHIQFSDQDRFLHEHEIYEMMRSRSLYQVQFDLKHKLRKRIRSLEQAEKMQISSFQKQRNVFLSKMQEKVAQRNKMAEEKSSSMMINGVKRQQQETENHLRPSYDNSEITIHARSAPCRLVSKESPRNRSVTKEVSNTRLVAKETTLSSVQEVSQENEESENIKPMSANVSLSLKGRSLQGCKSGYRRSRTTFSDDVTYINTSLIPNRPSEHTHELPTSLDRKPLSNSPGSFENLKLNSKNFRNFSSILKMPKIQTGESPRRNMTTFSDQDDNISEISDTAFQRLSGKYNTTKSYTSLSAPVFTPDLKALSTYEMGMITPQGQLILSRGEYEDYLEKFRKAKSKRLKLVRRESEHLGQKVKNFRAHVKN